MKILLIQGQNINKSEIISEVNNFPKTAKWPIPNFVAYCLYIRLLRIFYIPKGRTWMMEGNEESGSSARNLDYNIIKHRGCSERRRQTSSAPAAIYVTTLPKIATGRTIHSAKKFWKDHESIETAIREKSARECEENNRCIQFSKRPKTLKVSRLRQMKPFRIIHSEVFGMPKDKQKEMYAEVTYLTNAVRNCDGIHSFKNLSSFDHLKKQDKKEKIPRWRSANLEKSYKRMLPPAPPGKANKVFAWEVVSSVLSKDVPSNSKSTSDDLESGCSDADFRGRYGSSDQFDIEEQHKEENEKQRLKRREELLKTTRCASAGRKFVVDNNPDVNILRQKKHHSETRSKDRRLIDNLKKSHDRSIIGDDFINKSQPRKELRHRHKNAIPVMLTDNTAKNQAARQQNDSLSSTVETSSKKVANKNEERKDDLKNNNEKSNINIEHIIPDTTGETIQLNTVEPSIVGTPSEHNKS
ncbi:uncharacterized protein [Antedon mediterranea]|uniref:uncharacterized protein isoform X2 n=1 Tax=Antedon mediterranea TaxID=105859 RepID=UPI003AF49103